MRNRAKFILVWFLSAGSTLAHSQTRDDAFSFSRNRRPLPFAGSVADGGGGAISVARLNQVFDAARSSPRVEFTIGPEPELLPRLVGPRRQPGLVVPVPEEPPRAYQRTFRALSQRRDRTDRYDPLILKYSRTHELDPRLVKSIVAAESEFNPEAVSPKHAHGLMQVLVRTAEGMGVRGEALHDPEQNIVAGTAYLETLFRSAWRTFKLGELPYSDAPMWVMQRIIAAYHAGPRAIFGRRGWFRQTRHYVRRVLLFYRSTITDVNRRPAEPRPAQSSAGFFF
ncbi:MAG: lytic transglycosylase domain-containing protein [Elusimicrobia bacterium]|nr:lytic transglycosylase domain-containing protein [Elusimicrobiota bacterium]